MAYGNNNDSASGKGISKTEYAQRTRQLIKLITNLRGVGAQADIDLPRIAVIGNQSAGKSSLVEAISGITVPRASGTCTRCPMECRLQNSNTPWKCQIWLRFERDEMGKRIEDVHEVKFGEPLLDIADLEPMLRRAQLAILNPSVHYQWFGTLDLSQVVPGEPPFGFQKPLQFSSNVVALDLSGPDLVDLSFIDLPGIISNVAEGVDRGNINLVQDLVKEHIKGNALILLTLTMRDDLENQSAAFLAKEADPQGTRTIGVLTKADTILPGEESNWIAVLEGRCHTLKKGYYITKQPGPGELTSRLSFETARAREQDFFNRTEPWKSSSAMIKSRIGIPNLTAELSKMLSNLIMHTLPKLREEAQAALDETRKALNVLPPPLPDNPVIELLHILTAFSNVTKQWVVGAEKHEELVQLFRSASNIFKTKIRRTAPDFRPYKDVDEEEQRILEGKFHISLEDDETEEHMSDSSPMYLVEVQGYLRKSLSRELPYNVPYSAKQGLIEKSFSAWEKHALALFDTVCQATTRQLNKDIEDHFGRFSLSPLKDNTNRSVVDGQVNRLRKETTERIKWFLKLEYPPFTQNDLYFSSLREKYLAAYKMARKAEKPTLTPDAAVGALRELTTLGFEGLTVQDLFKLKKADEYEEDLVVMAEVSAYCRVAYKRVIDNIPRIIDHDFLHALGEHIGEALVNDFGIGSEKAMERARIYLMEDPSDVAKREELRAKETRLREVLDKLFNFGM